ncbi:MAG: hypothetical protein JKX68_02390 [Flavobacteriales bacterium]|nr:hypothetical protein [Flavobacteriales bacterium]
MGDMKIYIILLLSLSLLFCTPTGPQTFDSPFIGQTKNDLIAAKGIAKEIKIFDNAEVYIYKVREEYFGKKIALDKDKPLTPKKIVEIEYIYYINEKGYIYKYQIWKKRID